MRVVVSLRLTHWSVDEPEEGGRGGEEMMGLPASTMGGDGDGDRGEAGGEEDSLSGVPV